MEVRQPTPADAKARAKVVFLVGKHRRNGTLTYWPGHASSRPPTVVGETGSRFHPDRENVWVVEF